MVRETGLCGGIKEFKTLESKEGNFGEWSQCLLQLGACSEGVLSSLGSNFSPSSSPGLCPSLVSCLWLLCLQFWDMYPCRCFIPASRKSGTHHTTWARSRAWWLGLQNGVQGGQKMVQQGVMLNRRPAWLSSLLSYKSPMFPSRLEFTFFARASKLYELI